MQNHTRQVGITKKIFLVVAAVIAALVTFYLVFVVFYPKTSILMYGDRSFEGAQVYADNKRVAVMTWDDSKSQTYAKDIKYLQPGIIENIRMQLVPLSSEDQLFELPAHTGSVEFKVIKNDGGVYLKKISGMEDVSYNQYNLNDFGLVPQ